MKNVIAVLNTKGGVGKTTLAFNIARTMSLMGRKVVLIDTDGQRSAKTWATTGDGVLPCIEMMTKQEFGHFADVTSGYDYVVIDGRANMFNEADKLSLDLAINAIKRSGLVLIPVGPSPLDLWGSDSFVSLIHQTRELFDGKPPAYFVCNMAKKGGILSRELEDALGGYGLPVMESKVRVLEEFRKSPMQGLGVEDVSPKSEAAFDIRALVKEIDRLLSETEKLGSVSNV